MESADKDKKKQVDEGKEEEKELKEQIEEAKGEIEASEIKDPKEYLEKELKDVKLSYEQKKLLQDAMKDDSDTSVRENFKKLMSSLKD